MRCAAVFFIAAIFAPFAVAKDWMIVGRVVSVTDGDTVVVLDREKAEHKVRLAGIDAPEKAQAYGARSKENLSRLAFNRTVQAHCSKRDRYGREVCKVMRDTLDVNLEQVKLGLAWWYREYANEQTAEDRAVYSQAEDEARAYRRGLWKDPSPIAPWAWRRQ